MFFICSGCRLGSAPVLHHAEPFLSCVSQMASLTMGLGDALSPLQSVSNGVQRLLAERRAAGSFFFSAFCVCSGGGSAAESARHHVSRVRWIHLLRTRRGHHQAGLRPLWTNQKHRHVLGLGDHEAQGHTHTHIKHTPHSEVGGSNRCHGTCRASPSWNTRCLKRRSSHWSR